MNKQVLNLNLLFSPSRHLISRTTSPSSSSPLLYLLQSPRPHPPSPSPPARQRLFRLPPPQHDNHSNNDLESESMINLPQTGKRIHHLQVTPQTERAHACTPGWETREAKMFMCAPGYV
ncbi:hypothetical protein AMECASPLE_001260 [Ameca splendens]|uniref:Uncharacterized protein n=1 Tax=Ameca splendens TaxID=208324 RepID=A0ABV0YKC7_9TELE